MKHACAAAIALALLVVPAAGAVGLSIGYTVTAGTTGDNGWYRSAVTVQITVQGATDTNCVATMTFRSSNDVLNCSATDGNATIPFHLQFKIDTDAPTVSGGTPSRGADANGWFNQPVTIAFNGSDATSGIASCTSSSYGGPDSGSASVSGTCRDNAGNVSASGSWPLKYDSTAPSVSASADRAADGGGWYSHSVTVTFAGSDSTSGIDSCTAPVAYTGPDTTSTSVEGSCADHAGNRASGSLPLKYDSTPPSAAASVARKPDEQGWYTKPVVVTFSGSDALSGLASCTPAKTYDGPDAPTAKLTGTCHDKAGNAADAAAALKYDATAPRLKDVTAVPGAGDVTLTWRQPADVASVAVTRSPGRKGSRRTVIYRGKAPHIHDTGLAVGVAYRYRLTSLDQAGNRAVAGVTTKLRALFAPAPGARTHAGAMLRWAPEKTATYYNVQLFRGSRKVLSTWPVGTSFRLPRAWSYAGSQYRLSRGKYRWYVWPGLGPRANAKYGPLLGSSSFTVR
jgi:hypothetical protein